MSHNQQHLYTCLNGAKIFSVLQLDLSRPVEKSRKSFLTLSLITNILATVAQKDLIFQTMEMVHFHHCQGIKADFPGYLQLRFSALFQNCTKDLVGKHEICGTIHN